MPRAMTSRSIFANQSSIEPRRIGRSEVKLDARVAGEELANQLGFVGGEIVEDDVNLLPTRAQRYDLFEEGDEVAAGVAGTGFSMHASRLGVQRGIERKRAMAIVLEAVTFGASGRKWQNRVQPVQSLNRGLFIDAEHGGVLRRPQIQADNVGRLAFEVGIVAGQVTLQAVRFETGFLPHPMDGVFADAQGRRQFAAAPMGGTVAGFLACSRKNPGPQRRRHNAGLLPGMKRIQSIEPGFEKALLPADVRGRGRLQLTLHPVEGG